MRNLKKDDLNDIESYCKSRCSKIVCEYKNEHIHYYRGLYKGYLFTNKLARYFKMHNKEIPFYLIYNLIKEKKRKIQYEYHPNSGYIAGIVEAMYDVQNYLNGIDSSVFKESLQIALI